VSSNDVVLEIGPGPGALTEALLATGAVVVAVEMDRILAAALERLNGPDRRLHVICEDILQVPLEETLRPLLREGQKVKVIANLPYHVTTPILTRCVELTSLIESLTVMVQKEFAERVTAAPGGRDYSSLTVYLNFYTRVRYAFDVSDNCFYPKPKVHSAVVTLHLKTPPQVTDQQRFFQLTRTAFEHRRKMLRSSLREIYQPEKVMTTLQKVGASPLARPQELSLEQFLVLFEKLEATLETLS
jgi:16S rRNA (adenine1518-N6/adenine1519-N6)-dimethyltransferase